MISETINLPIIAASFISLIIYLFFYMTFESYREMRSLLIYSFLISIIYAILSSVESSYLKGLLMIAWLMFFYNLMGHGIQHHGKSLKKGVSFSIKITCLLLIILTFIFSINSPLPSVLHFLAYFFIFLMLIILLISGRKKKDCFHRANIIITIFSLIFIISNLTGSGNFQSLISISLPIIIVSILSLSIIRHHKIRTSMKKTITLLILLFIIITAIFSWNAFRITEDIKEQELARYKDNTLEKMNVGISEMKIITDFYCNHLEKIDSFDKLKEHHSLDKKILEKVTFISSEKRKNYPSGGDIIRHEGPKEMCILSTGNNKSIDLFVDGEKYRAFSINISSIINKIDFLFTSELIITDKDHQIIYSKDLSRIGEHKEFKEESGIRDGNYEIIYPFNMKGKILYFYTSKDIDEIYSPVRGGIRSIIVYTIIIISSLTLGFSFLFRNITGRLRKEIRSKTERLNQKLAKEEENRKRMDELIRNLKSTNKELEDKKGELEKLYKYKNRWSKMLEKEVKRQTERLRTANRNISNLLQMKTQLMNQVAHDLRTPLTPIKILTKLILSKEDLDPKTKERMEIIKRNTDSLNYLVTDVLSLVRLDSEKHKPVFKDTDLNAVIEDFIITNGPTFEKEGIKINKSFDKIPNVKIDRNKINEVIGNIVSNAKKYMDKKKELTFETKKLKKEVMVKITDSGKGVSKENLEKLFSEFFKVNQYHGGGSIGLGLSICKKIISQHKGKIWAESPGLGKGTSIIFTIPIGDKDESDGSR
ncbi:MAG: ATP-binding protein [Nanobdellota archaeon]